MVPYQGSFRLVSPYGMRSDPFSGEYVMHGGVDLVGCDTKEICAVFSGTVVRSRMVTDTSNRTWEWGNYVSVAGDDGMTVYYCHLSSRMAEAGQYVRAGEVIGSEGTTGKSTGSHLHLEVRSGGYDTVNAADYIGIPNACGMYDSAVYGAYGGDDCSEWACDAVKWAKENGILLGDGMGNYMLDSPCTREQMCVFLYRLYERIKRKEI